MSEAASGSVQYGDHRDQSVINAFEPGDEATVERFQSLYRARTDVKGRRTLRDRIKNLTTYGPFERTGFQQWRYTGGE